MPVVSAASARASAGSMPRTCPCGQPAASWAPGGVNHGRGRFVRTGGGGRAAREASRGRPARPRRALPRPARTGAVALPPAARRPPRGRRGGRNVGTERWQREAAPLPGDSPAARGPQRHTMSRCLTDRTLMLLQAGEGGAGERAHLRACPPCATRYRALEDDLGVVADALRADPPPGAARPRLRWRAVGALAATVVLAVGGAWMWRAARVAPPAGGRDVGV